jgi:excisionase family DNA binding protein
VTDRALQLRSRLEAAFAPDVIEALEALVEELVEERLHGSGSESPWLSVKEGADYLGVSERTLERMIAGDRIGSSTIGRRRLVRRAELDNVPRDSMKRRRGRT